MPDPDDSLDLRRAGPGDVETVRAVLEEASPWLLSRYEKRLI